MQIEITESERDQIRYALMEQASMAARWANGRAAEKYWRRSKLEAEKESRELKALAGRIGRAT